MRIWRLLLMPCIAMTVGSLGLVAQQNQTIYDEDVKLVQWADDIEYPPLAEMARIQGTVVVKVTLGRDGRVVAASAISGHPLLIHACLPNAEKWKFKPNPQESAILVYVFRLGEDWCPKGAYNVIRPPNFVVVTGCLFLAQP